MTLKTAEFSVSVLEVRRTTTAVRNRPIMRKQSRPQGAGQCSHCFRGGTVVGSAAAVVCWLLHVPAKRTDLEHLRYGICFGKPPRWPSG